MNVETSSLLARLSKKYHDRVVILEYESDLVDNCKFMLYWSKDYTDGEVAGGSYPVKSITEAVYFVKNNLFKVERN